MEGEGSFSHSPLVWALAWDLFTGLIQDAIKWLPLFSGPGDGLFLGGFTHTNLLLSGKEEAARHCGEEGQTDFQSK